MIRDSYLGWVDNFSKRMNEKTLKPREMIRLTSVSKAFDGQKIESVCVQSSEGNTLILQLVSDNDNGETGLFKLQLEL